MTPAAVLVAEPRSRSWCSLRTRSVWTRSEEDEILARAAQLSYFFLLALFPLLVFLITLLGYFNGAGSHLQRKLISYLGGVMPPAALQLVVVTLDEVTKSRGTGKLSLGILLALWAASSGLNALAQALNAAYEVRETRPWWKVRLLSLALTITLSVLIISALLIVLYGGQFGEALAGMIHEGDVFAIVWRILQWPIALAFVLVAFVMIYRFVPNVAAKREGLSPPLVVAGRRYRHRALAARISGLSSLSALLQFIQCHLWIARRADHPDVVVLSDRRGDSARRRNQLRV